jgi:hypothetical protein
MTRQQSAGEWRTGKFLSFLNSVISFSQLRSALLKSFGVSKDILVVYEVLNLATMTLAQQMVCVDETEKIPPFL